MPNIHDEYPGNLNTEIHQNLEISKKAFAEAYYVRRDVFQGQRAYQSPIEAHCAISMWKDNKLTIYSTTQSTHYFQYYIAGIRLEMGDVRIIKPYIGGALAVSWNLQAWNLTGLCLPKLQTARKNVL